MIEFWTILVGALASVSCGLVGCYLVLRRMSLLGDAISHAVLPGIAIAFFLTGHISGPAIVVGAMAVGILTAFLTQSISQATFVPEDASLGVVFTTFFAAGVVLITVGARHVDLDPGCVLYGLIEFTPFDTTEWFGVDVPRALVSLSLALFIVITVITLFWKELKLAAFDPALATALGFSATLLHYLLMAVVAGVTVASFEAVGSILVVAMLIVPAATAQLLTDRFSHYFLLTIGIGILSSVLGYYSAVMLNTSVAGMMAVMVGLLFTTALLFAPRYGLIARIFHQLRLSLRIVREDILGWLYRAEERQAGSSGVVPFTETALAQQLPHIAPWLLRLALWQSRRRGLVLDQENGLCLSQAGQQQAEQLVRAHRLWETYLEQNVALPPDHLHDPAEKMEHYLGPGLVESLAKETREPAKDPHGRKIPQSHPG